MEPIFRVRRWSGFVGRLDRYPAIQKIVTNIGWLLTERLLNVIASLLIGAWVARYLGPGQLGQLQYAQSLAWLFLALATLGLDSIVVRNIIRRDASPEEILGTAFVLRFVASWLTFLLLALLAVQLQTLAVSRMLILLSAGSLLFVSAFGTVELQFQAQVRSKYVVWVKNVTLIILSLLRIISILSSQPLIVFGVVTALQSVLHALGFVYILHREGHVLLQWRFRWWMARRMLWDAGPLIVSGTAFAVFLRIDQVMLEAMVDNAAVGVYGAAVRVSELWYIVPEFVAMSLFPAIVRSKEQQTDIVYQQRIQAFYDFIVAASLGIAIAVTLLAYPVVLVLYGPAYVDTAGILQIHVWALIFMSIEKARSRWLYAENMTGFLIVANTVAAVSNILLNLWLIPRFAGFGAAWSTLFSYAIAGYLTCVLDRRLWPVFRQLTMALLIPFRLRSSVRMMRLVAFRKPESPGE